MSRIHIVTCDFEAYYDKNITLKKMGTMEYVMKTVVLGVAVKLDDNPPEFFTHDEFRLLAKRIWTGSSSDPMLLAHNVRYDGAELAFRYGVVPPLYIDTMSMARALIRPYTRNGSVSLDACAEYFGLPKKLIGVLDDVMGKRWEDLNLLEQQTLAEYAKHDAQLCWDIFQRMRYDFPQEEYTVVDSTIRMYLQPRLVLDEPYLGMVVIAEKERKREALAVLGLTAKELRSRDRFASLLRQHGVEPPTKVSRTTGKMTYAFAKTDSGMLSLQRHPDPKVRQLVATRLSLSSSIDETRAERMHHLSTLSSLWCVPLVYYGTHTGRYTGDEWINALNPPRSSPVRAGIQAPPGHKIVSVDLAQIEARLAAWWAGTTDLLDDFRQKQDVYAKFSTGMYSRPITKENNPDERQVGKLAILQLQYGAAAKRFLQVLINEDLAQDDVRGMRWSEAIVQYYRNRYPSIPTSWNVCTTAIGRMYREMASYHDTPVDFYKQVFYEDSVGLPSGLKLHYPNLKQEHDPTHNKSQVVYWSGRGFHTLYGAKLFENICQALARVIIIHMMAVLTRLAQPILQMHDALLWVVADDVVPSFVKEVKREMTKPPSWAPSLPLDVDVKVSQHL